MLDSDNEGDAIKSNLACDFMYKKAIFFSVSFFFGQPDSFEL